MNSTPATTAARRRRGRLALLLLVLVFFAPLILAFLVYYGSSWRPVGHTNHGTLLGPRSLPATGYAGQPLFARRWSLVYVGPGGCPDECRRALYFMHQTRLSLGNLLPRVQAVFLGEPPCCDDASFGREFPGLIVVPASAGLIAAFPADRAHTVFIVDPIGNLMMRYDTGADPKGLREDLKKLLELSHIG